MPLLAWTLGVLPVAHATETVQRRLTSMGTWLDVSVTAADRRQALAASEAAVRAVEATDRRLSSWRPDSELSALNTAPVGVWQGLSPELAADLDRARWCSAQTGGAFDPVLGPLVEARGLRTVAPSGSEQSILAALEHSGWAGIELDGQRARRLSWTRGASARVWRWTRAWTRPRQRVPPMSS
ncbi:MAG: hypothetical protein GXP62_03990 [Oligoflexia bacterium]|nr:hypothetical protein [Oligoflexia bacterium]